MQKYAEYNRNWRIKNKDRLRIYDREYEYSGNWLKTLKRDKWTCQTCKKDLTKYRPHVHHKDKRGFSVVGKKANNNMDNLISLCISCHKKLHPETCAKYRNKKGQFCTVNGKERNDTRPD